MHATGAQVNRANIGEFITRHDMFDFTHLHANRLLHDQVWVYIVSIFAAIFRPIQGYSKAGFEVDVDQKRRDFAS